MLENVMAPPRPPKNDRALPSSSTPPLSHSHRHVIAPPLKIPPIYARLRQAISIVRANNIPHIFLTNGGGNKEADKAKQLESWLNQMLES